MDEHNSFKSLVGKVRSISEHKNAPFTIEMQRKLFLLSLKDAVTIDPRCSFYKGDKVPKTIDIIALGDNIKVTYMVHGKIKVAFNVVVL